MAVTITDQLIKFSASEIPTDAVRMMRLSLFDWAACGIAGAKETEFSNFAESQLAIHPGQQTVFGKGSASAATAALINGTLSHALDYDDTHFAHIGHPSVAVIPAVLALAEQTNADFDSFINAAAVGVEASILVGLWLGRDHYQVGFHQTATAGAFGATLGACRLLNLSSLETRHALGICASMASGIKQQFGTMAKPLNAGLAARTGVESAIWAQSGMTAAHDGLAGPLGFGPTHHGQAAQVSMTQTPWYILSISHKFHACCHGLHAMLEALSEAELSKKAVKSLHVQTHPRWMSVCNNTNPQTGLAAKFSYTQTAAMSLLGQDTGSTDSFSDQITQDEKVSDLRSRITVNENAQLTETQTEIDVCFQDDSSQHLSHDLLAPMTMQTRVGKLRRKADALLGKSHAQALWDASEGSALNDLSRQLSIS